MARNDLHITETARIVENQRPRLTTYEYDMIMRVILSSRMVEFARRLLIILLG